MELFGKLPLTLKSLQNEEMAVKISLLLNDPILTEIFKKIVGNKNLTEE